MAVKKKSAPANKDTSGAFFANMKKKGSILKKVGKEKASQGYTTKEDIIAALFPGKSKGERVVTCKAKCTSARVGVNDGNSFASFNFVIVDGVGKGQTPSKYLELVERGNRTEEMALKDLVFTLQRLGYETDNLTDARLKEIIESIKTDKPLAMIRIKYDGTYLNTDVLRGLEDDDDDSEEEEEEDESDTEDDDESEETDEEEDSDEDSDDSDDDEDSEEEDDEDSFDENDPNTWVGMKVTAKTASMKKAAKVTLLKFTKAKKSFEAKDSKGTKITVKVSEIAEFE